MGTAVPTTNELAQERTDLAAERTRLAHERTLMAWIRTAASLISFGFTIYKFFEYMNEQTAARGGQVSTSGPRSYALAMISVGLVSLIVATLEHQNGRRALAKQGITPPRSLALIVAALVAGLGVLGATLVLLRQ